jgi:1-acyl-sn-glycerol-3-phosphate acyltransferase
MSLYRNIVKTAAPFIMGYHRVEYFGAENIPPAGSPCIITPNHSSWLGWDGMVVNSILKERTIRWVGWSYEDEFPLWDKIVDNFEPIWVNKKKPFPFDMVVRDILGNGDSVGIFPEGNSNPIGKWYRLRKFQPGCIKLSQMSGAPIIPTSIAGIEEASPVLWQDEPLGRPAANAIPIPVLLPTKVKVRFGHPIHPDPSITPPYDQAAMETAAKKIREEILILLKNDRPNAYVA